MKSGFRMSVFILSTGEIPFDFLLSHDLLTCTSERWAEAQVLKYWPKAYRSGTSFLRSPRWIPHTACIWCTVLNIRSTARARRWQTWGWTPYDRLPPAWLRSAQVQSSSLVGRLNPYRPVAYAIFDRFKRASLLY